MLLFLYICVFSLDVILCGVTDKSHVDAAKSAKLINLVQQLNDIDDAVTKKIAQNGRRFRENYNHRRVHLISNPEVLDIYKKQPSRRQEEENYVYNSLEERLPFSAAARKEVLRGGGLLSMHYLSNPEALNTYRRQMNKDLTSSSDTDSSSFTNGNDARGNSRRILKKKTDNIKNKKQDIDLGSDNEPSISRTPSDGTDVTMKLEETFDIVKPFFVEIFNKLKDKKYESESKSSLETYETNKNSKSSDYEFSDRTGIEKRLTNKLHEISKTSKDKESDDFTDTDSIYINNFSITTSNEKPYKETNTKKQLVEKIYHSKNKEKEDTSNLYDKYWSKKKLPANKKSFFEPPITHDDIDEAYHDIKDKNDDSSETWHNNRFKKNNDWNKKNKKDDSDFNTSVKKKSIESFHKKKKDWRQYDNDKNDASSDGIKKRKKDNVWDKKDNNWNKKEDNNYDWNEVHENRSDKKTDWDKNDDTNNKKDWNRQEKDNNWNKYKTNNGRNKKEDRWDKKEDTRNKKDNNWNKQEDNINKKEDNWNKKNEKWTKMDVNWNKKANDWNKMDEKWNKKDDDWAKKNKGSDSWNDKNDKISKQSNKREYEWDMVGKNMKKKNSEWGNYDAFKTKPDKHISVEKTTKDEVKIYAKSKPKAKNSWDEHIPKYPVHFDNARTIRNNYYNSGERKINRQSNYNYFVRTPIPVVNKAVYDR